MKATELFLSIVFLVAIAMILTLLAGHIIALIAGSLLGMLYFYLGIVLFNEKRLKDNLKPSNLKDIGTAKILLGIITGVAISNVVIGILSESIFILELKSC